MTLKIIKLNNKYALRKGIFFKYYADLDDLRLNTEIYWWSLPYPQCFTNDLEYLKRMISSYEWPSKETVIETVKV